MESRPHHTTPANKYRKRTHKAHTRERGERCYWPSGMDPASRARGQPAMKFAAFAGGGGGRQRGAAQRIVSVRFSSVWCSVLGAGRASERATTLFQRDVERAERCDQRRHRRVGHQ
eukprot:6950406-Prymnesium_polylepis.1